MTHSATVRVAGNEFTAYYTMTDNGAKIESVYFSEYPDDISPLLKPVVLGGIARECAKAHRAESEYAARREDMERLEA